MNQNVAADTVETFSFNTKVLKQPGDGGVGVPAINRTYLAGDLFQSRTDLTPGGKTPFALLSIVAKSEALRRRAFQASPQPAADEIYETRLSALTDFTDVTEFGPADAPVSGIEVTGMERVGNFLMLDLAAPAGTGWDWKVMGTDNVAIGFSDDLTSLSTVMEGPPGTGIYKVTVDLSGRGERYFLRIEK